MKKSKIIGLVIRTILYLLIGGYLFLELVNFVQFPTSPKPPIVKESFSIEKEEQKIAQSAKDIKVYQDKSVALELEKRFKLNKNKDEITQPTESGLVKDFKEKYIFFDYVLNNNNVVIPFLYLLTLSTFLIQIFLLSLSNYYNLLLNFFDEKKLDSIFLYSSEWTINAPPVLGVVGTIFSFGMVVSNLSDMSSLSTVFKENFANAALTTIIGGSVYVINLFINIFIAKNLSK